MKIINLTPHEVKVFMPDGSIKVYPKVNNPARLIYKTSVIGYAEDIPLIHTDYNTVVGLPDKAEDTLLIVSPSVYNLIQDRDDLIIPTGIIRDGKTILGCCSFGSKKKLVDI